MRYLFILALQGEGKACDNTEKGSIPFICSGLIHPLTDEARTIPVTDCRWNKPSAPNVFSSKASMSESIDIGDQVIGINHGWAGTIASVSEIRTNDPYGVTLIILVEHRTNRAWDVGAQFHVYAHDFKRYMP